MSSSSDMLRFSFPTHASVVLSKLNLLREEYRFCDITLILRASQGSHDQPVLFHAHKVLLAASSDFLRDQFLLHEGQAELSVGVVSSVRIAQKLLLSCYTGHLEVPVGELVSYLTAASTLQMTQVVDKCAQAISHYLSPTLALLKPEGDSHEKEIQQLDNSWPDTSAEKPKEKDAAQPCISIQEASTQEGDSDTIQFNLKVSQGVREVRVDRKALIAKDVLENAACCNDTLESGEVGDNHMNNTLFQDTQTVGILNNNLQPSASSPNPVSSTITSPAESVENSLSQQEPEADKATQQEEECSCMSQGGKTKESHTFCFSRSHLSNRLCATDKEAEESDGLFVQRPYLCRQCDRVFQHLESYAGHLKDHRQFFCLVCGKDFSQKSKLTRHIRVHTGVKPFRCPLCHKTFFQRATLQDHLNLHTGVRPQRNYLSSGHLNHKSSLRYHLREKNGKGRHQNVSEGAENCQ